MGTSLINNQPKCGPTAEGRNEETSEEKLYSFRHFNEYAPPITINGEYSLKFDVLGVRVMLAPDVEFGEDVYDSLAQTLEDNNITGFHYKTLKKKFAGANGGWVELSKTLIGIPSPINVRISNDRLRAYLILLPAQFYGGISVEEVERVLEAKRLLDKADRRLIRYMMENGLFGQVMLLAQGTEPIPGEAAGRTYHFKPVFSTSPRLLDNGDVDFKSIDNVSIVKSGDVLVTKTPALHGIPGEDVWGGVIPAPKGHDIDISGGKNTQLSADGTELTATCEGHVFIRYGKVCVDRVFIVEGNVDYKVGNIDFNGPVIVFGSVLDGFKVKADDDIYVNGSVDGAELESRGGDISIRLGINGHNKAEVKAAGSVKAKFINMAIVRAGKDVISEVSILHSSVIAGESVIARGSKGAIIGGSILAAKSIVARELGCISQTKTEITLEKTDADAGEPLRDVLQHKYASTIYKLARARVEIEMFNRMAEKADDGEGYIEKEIAAGNTVVELKDELRKLKTELNRLKEEIIPGGIRYLEVLNDIHPGVDISVEGEVLSGSESLRNCRICLNAEGRLIIKRIW